MKEGILGRIKLFWLRTKTFFQKHRKIVLIVSPILFIFLVAGIFWFVSRPRVEEETNINIVAKPPTVLASLTNGVKVSPDIANRHPVAVMIENSQVARPQAGLTSADIVYEAVTEGGITRFMGIYSQNYPDQAGPVRSARSYFIDWLSEYDAFYAHAGGSPTALGRISDYGIKDYPHSNDAYTRIRQAGVSSEHTLFVDVSKIFNFGIEKKNWPKTFNTKSWLFKDPEQVATTNTKLSIDFSSAPFVVDWIYDPTIKKYARQMAGIAHKDRISGEQIKATTVITMNVRHSANPPYSGTGKESEWNMATIGTGDVSVFQDGLRINGQWKKTSRTERTRFFDSAGVEITLNRGVIWIEIVPQEGTITSEVSAPVPAPTPTS